MNSRVGQSVTRGVSQRQVYLALRPLALVRTLAYLCSSSPHPQTVPSSPQFTPIHPHHFAMALSFARHGSMKAFCSSTPNLVATIAASFNPATAAAPSTAAMAAVSPKIVLPSALLAVVGWPGFGQTRGMAGHSKWKKIKHAKGPGLCGVVDTSICFISTSHETPSWPAFWDAHPLTTPCRACALHLPLATRFSLLQELPIKLELSSRRKCQRKSLLLSVVRLGLFPPPLRACRVLVVLCVLCFFVATLPATSDVARLPLASQVRRLSVVWWSCFLF